MKTKKVSIFPAAKKADIGGIRAALAENNYFVEHVWKALWWIVEVDIEKRSTAKGKLLGCDPKYVRGAKYLLDVLNKEYGVTADGYPIPKVKSFQKRYIHFMMGYYCGNNPGSRIDINSFRQDNTLSLLAYVSIGGDSDMFDLIRDFTQCNSYIDSAKNTIQTYIDTNNAFVKTLPIALKKAMAVRINEYSALLEKINR